MKILALGIALFHAGGRMDERTDMTRVIAFTSALQTYLKEASARQHRYRCISPRLHWSQNRQNTTVWTPDKEVDIYHITTRIIYNKPTRCNSGGIVFIKNYKYALHVSDALCVHLQEQYTL